MLTQVVRRVQVMKKKAKRYFRERTWGTMPHVRKDEDFFKRHLQQFEVLMRSIKVRGEKIKWYWISMMFDDKSWL